MTRPQLPTPVSSKTSTATSTNNGSNNMSLHSMMRQRRSCQVRRRQVSNYSSPPASSSSVSHLRDAIGVFWQELKDLRLPAAVAILDGDSTDVSEDEDSDRDDDPVEDEALYGR